MKEALQIGAWIGGMLGGVSLLVQFFSFVLKKGKKISWHLFYLSLLILAVPFVYILTNVQATKKLDKHNEYVVKPYVTLLTIDIRDMRDSLRIKSYPLEEKSGNQKYSEECLKILTELRHLEAAEFRLTSESYFELGLLAYYREEYSEAIRCARKAIALNPYDTEVNYLISRSYHCMDERDSARFYYQKYDTIKRRQQNKIPFP